MSDNHKKFRFNLNGKMATTEVPKACPHCGIHIEPLAGAAYISHYEENKRLIHLTLRCPSCLKYYFTLHLADTPKSAEFISVYPSLKPVRFHELIEQTSPRFVETYNQAYAAEQLNHLELAGMGYRLSLEILIKDFAIKQLDKTPEEVDMKLVNAIKQFVGDSDLLQSADVVRILGNDYSHYIKEHDIEFSVLKDYLDIFISQVLVKLKIQNPPVSRKH